MHSRYATNNWIMQPGPQNCFANNSFDQWAQSYDCKTDIFLTMWMQIRFRKRNKARGFANMQFLTLKRIIPVCRNLNENRDAVLACHLNSLFSAFVSLLRPQYF